MDKKEVTAYFKANGATILQSGRYDTGYYLFGSEEKVYDVRNNIPFLTLYQGTYDGKELLIVYFDKLKLVA